ncbi:MarR family transcriptional regulator [Lachnospiraceae bacterium MD1]|uniref:MarR family transcriptional regulator n=1 Tax=Variimorphobacter saccharofermentans TaxID=2755051 RepID=A0A839K3B7_9FIRM|nr:MarR family transcriptional regulator [Variimorphobacter saccharofermentans]MBB2184403.1 MarR family transcriptional regulator [Variimorphobacter saccharofermentans]
MNIRDQSLEEIIFQFIDQCKFLFFPEQWNNTFLDYSKNETFTLFLIYRKGTVNMTEIADYLGVPLNTVTGIVSRLEKKNVIIRQRDLIDKRIVTVSMSSYGKDTLKQQLNELGQYFTLVLSRLTDDELDSAIKIIRKIFDILQDGTLFLKQEPPTAKKVKRIPIE